MDADMTVEYNKNLSRRFRQDRRGSIAIVFALMLTMTVSIVGGAVDYARWLQAKSATVHAMDAAVIAGGRELLIGKTEAQALLTAQSFYDNNKSNLLDVNSIAFSVTESGTKVVAVSDSTVKTTLLGVAGISELRFARQQAPTCRLAQTPARTSKLH